ncbi:MAG: hypothetical protein ACI9OD_004825, partial [Limisphaerales bacterium]
ASSSVAVGSSADPQLHFNLQKAWDHRAFCVPEPSR